MAPLSPIVSSLVLMSSLSAQGAVLPTQPGSPLDQASGASRGANAASAVSPGSCLVSGNHQLDLFSGRPMRIQQVYDHDSFAGGSAVVIRKLRFRVARGMANGNHGGHSVAFAIWMSYGPTSPHKVDSRNLSDHFDKNLDPATLRRVLKRTKIQLPRIRSRDFELVLPLDSSLSYALVRGLRRSLVVDIRFFGASQGPTPYYPLDALESSTFGQGSIVANGNYPGCLSKSMFPVWHSSHSTRLKVGNLGFYCTGDGKAPGLASFMSVGARASGFSIPGAVSYSIPCRAVNDMLFLIGGVTDASGIFVAKMPLIDDPRLLNLSFYTQAFFFEKGANSAGVTSSNGIKQTVGPGNPWVGGSVGICHAGVTAAVPDPDKLKLATVRAPGVGLVTLFDN